MYVVKKKRRATDLCLGCGTAGKSELRASKYNHTLPALTPSLFCPDTTAHQTCAGVRCSEVAMDYCIIALMDVLIRVNLDRRPGGLTIAFAMGLCFQMRAIPVVRQRGKAESAGPRQRSRSIRTGCARRRWRP